MKKLPVIIIVLLVIPGIVYAHALITKMTPGKDAVLTDSPPKVMLQLSKPIETAFSKIEVFNQKEEKVSKSTVFSEDAKIMEADLRDDLESGEYVVKWVCMSKDGHTQKGSYIFTVK